MSVATSTHAAVSVTSSATAILSAASTRRGAVIVNNGATTVYLGKNSSVSTSNGIPVAAGQSFTIDGREYLGAVYGITASATENVRYWEFA